jgi:hypothetical protein
MLNTEDWMRLNQLKRKGNKLSPAEMDEMQELVAKQYNFKREKDD